MVDLARGGLLPTGLHFCFTRYENFKKYLFCGRKHYCMQLHKFGMCIMYNFAITNKYDALQGPVWHKP